MNVYQKIQKELDGGRCKTCNGVGIHNTQSCGECCGTGIDKHSVFYTNIMELIDNMKHMYLEYRSGSVYLKSDDKIIINVFFFSELRASHPTIFYVIDALSQVLKLDFGGSITHPTTGSIITRTDYGFNFSCNYMGCDNSVYSLPYSDVEQFTVDVVKKVNLNCTALSYR